MTSQQLFAGPWQHVPYLIEQTDKFYAEHVTPKCLGDACTLAAERIVKERHWEPSLSLIKENLIPIIRELEIRYVPKQVDPGPCILFPLHDYRNLVRHGMIKPLYPLAGQNGPMKYALLGKEKTGGPRWFGQSDDCLRAIVHNRAVCLVEGYFDLLACRLLHPAAPILSTGTKSVNDMHIEWLQLLGVKRVHLLFDNEEAKEGRTEGAGNEAARSVARTYANKVPVMKFVTELCPANDPSDCLQDLRTTYALQGQLRRMFPVAGQVDEDL
jgi:hypothetical protein